MIDSPLDVTAFEDGAVLRQDSVQIHLFKSLHAVFENLIARHIVLVEWNHWRKKVTFGKQRPILGDGGKDIAGKKAAGFGVVGDDGAG